MTPVVAAFGTLGWLAELVCGPLATTGGREPHRLLFGLSAQEADERARRLVMSHLPFLIEPGRLNRQLQGRAWHVACEEGVEARTLDGRSFGLPMCLAYASLFMGRPLPRDLVASAEVAEDGRLLSVEGLREKIRVCDLWAPGLRRFLVATEQVGQAAQIAGDIGSPLEIVGAGSVEQAMDIAFPDMCAWLRQRWMDPDLANADAHALFHLVLRPNALVLQWKGVLGAATELASQRGLSRIASWEAAFVVNVAERHAGRARPIQAWREHYDRLPRPIGLQVLAHVIQSAADSGRREILEEVPTILGPCQGFREELEIQGALGRILAAEGRYDQAVVALRAAVDGWFALDLPQEASRPLCELLRVLGILGRLMEVAAIAEVRKGPLESLLRSPSASDHDAGFVRLAAGRALQQCGQPARALSHLVDEVSPWHDLDSHLAASRLRWLAACQRDLGSTGTEGSMARLSEIALRNPSEAGFAWCLARLDHALHTGRDPSEILAELAALPEDLPDMARIIRLFAPSADAREQARAVARHWRY